MPPAPETPRPPGDDAFAPADDRLLAFLRRKLAGEPLPADVGAHFHDEDIYAADPATLTAGYNPAPARKGEGGSWFFFTHVRPKSGSDSRKSRRVGDGSGTWHSERAPRRVLDGEGNCVGQGQYFSFKRKVGKGSERTDWYMMEFCEEDQGADHGRVHGGEPQLVLCKIYKAHARSRNANGSASRSSSSASARKRKATDDCVDVASAPVKAKRKLFDSSVPVLAATSQEELSAVSWFAAWQDNINASATPDSALGYVPEMPQEKLNSEGWIQQEKLSSESRMQEEKLSSECWINWQDKIDASGDTPCESHSHSFWMPETEESQVNTRNSFLMVGNAAPVPTQALFSASLVSDSAFRTQQDPYVSSWMLETETEESRFNTSSSFLMAGNAPPVSTLESAFRNEQDPCDRFWMPEREVSQVDTSSFLVADDDLSLPSNSRIGNGVTPSCCSEFGCFLGAPTYHKELGSGGAGFTGENMCSMPSSFPVPPPTSPSWWYSTSDI